jgi:hypothetical protein
MEIMKKVLKIKINDFFILKMEMEIEKKVERVLICFCPQKKLN